MQSRTVTNVRSARPVVEDDVHVCSARVEDHIRFLPSLMNLLSDAERERASRFHFRRDRDRYVVARGVLREILAAYTDRTAASFTFSYGPRGKPMLSLDDTGAPVFFNVSHSGSMLLFAVSSSFDIGVDVELIDDGTLSEALVARCLSPQEVDFWNAVPVQKRGSVFFKTWVRKEAYMKGLGVGLALEPSSFRVSLGPQQTLEGRRNHLGRSTHAWQLIELHVGAGAEAALAVEGAPPSTPIHYHRWTHSKRVFL